MAQLSKYHSSLDELDQKTQIPCEVGEDERENKRKLCPWAWRGEHPRFRYVAFNTLMRSSVNILAVGLIHTKVTGCSLWGVKVDCADSHCILTNNANGHCLNRHRLVPGGKTRTLL
jgi:hypothetical protein